MNDQKSPSADHILDRKLMAALALVALAVFANSLWNGFAFDDDYIILRNTRVHQLADLSQIWGTPYWPSFGAELGLYRPLTIFAFALQWAAADGAPWIFHAVNVALHALVTVLVFQLLRTLVKAWPAAVGALLFALHPVHTEVVANGVGQAELLAAAGILGVCVLYAGRPRDSLRAGPLTVLAIVAIYFLSLFAKEGAIILPALLVLLDVTQNRVRLKYTELRAYAGQLWMMFFLMAAAGFLYLAIRTDVLGSISGVDAAPSLPFLREENRVLVAFRAWPEYVRLLFFPLDLSADYLPAIILPVESLTPMTLLGALILAGTIAIALLTPRHPQAGFVAAWFFITILTVSNLLFPIGVVVAERTLYTPSVALAAAAAFSWEALQATWPAHRRRLATAGLAVVCVLFAIKTVDRNPVWKDSITVLGSIAQDHPESYRSAWLMAEMQWRHGDLDRAAYYWEAAMLLWPRDSQLMNDFANFHIARRDWDRAVELLKRSRAQHPWVPRTHELLAFAYAYMGEPALALESSQEAFRQGGARTILFAATAMAYEQQGRLGEAVGAWRSAVRTPRRPSWVHKGMQARAQARMGDQASALLVADSALRAHAQDSLAVSTLSSLRTAIGMGCYHTNAPPACADPLAEWSINGERIVPQKVSNSKNVSTGNQSMATGTTPSQDSPSYLIGKR